MKLSNNQIDYLMRFRNRCTEREFIIDTLAYVEDRPYFICYHEEFPTGLETVHIEYNQAPSTAKYEPPYNREQMLKNGYEIGLVNTLTTDPVHAWRMEHQIDLVHQEPTVWELLRVWRNWQLMTPEQKTQSDTKSKELFGIDNETHFRILWENAHKEHKLDQGELIALIDASTHNMCVVYITDLDMNHVDFNYIGNGSTRLFNETDEFNLNPHIVDCYSKGDPLPTTFGRFLLNMLLVELPFKGKIPYCNTPGFDLKEIENSISAGLLNDTISVQEYKTYINNLYFIGHFCEICVPTYTKAALTTDPAMSQIKQNLLEKYKGKLDDPKNISELENALIAADKAYLKNDEVMRFYTPLGGKPFNIARKKMYLTIGGVEAFSKDSGKYDFIQNSLSEGWTNDSISSVANEIRKGSYNRGHETQLGGAQTKYIMRVFQDLCIVEDDCGTNRGLLVDFGLYNPKDFKGRYALVNGKWEVITADNLEKYKGKKYLIRSPMFCKSEHGLCKKCAGDVYASLNIKHVSMYIVDISSTFTTMALKLMHGSKIELVDLGDLNQYLL